MTKWTTLGLLLLAIQTANAIEKEQSRPKEAKVSVDLSFSVEEYDPSTPSKAVMKCVVRNDPAEAIQVPASYDATDLKRKIAAADDPDVIASLARSLADAVKAKKELESQVLVRIEPGKERVVFEFPLDEILLHGKTRDGSLGWGWNRHLRPPKSPIYRSAGSRDLVGEVSFTVRLKTGGQTVDSKEIRLKVKSSD